MLPRGFSRVAQLNTGKCFRLLSTPSVASLSSESTVPTEVDPLSGFVNSIRETSPIEFKTYAANTTLSGIKNMLALHQWISDQKSISSSDAVDVLQLASSIHNGNAVSADFLKTSSALSAALCQPLEVRQSLSALTFIFQLGLKDSTSAEYLLKELENLKEPTSVPMEIILPFLVAISKNNIDLSGKLLMNINQIVEFNTPDISRPSELLGILNYSNFKSRKWMNKIAVKTIELISVMSLGEIVSIFGHFASKGERSFALLNHISSDLSYSSECLSLNQLILLSQSCVKLSFYDARVLRKISADLIVNVNNINKWSDASSIAESFARLRLGEPDTWSALVHWANAHLDSAHPKFLSIFVSSMARIGIQDCGNCAKVLAQKLKPEFAAGQNTWLNAIHSLAYFNALTPKLAESVMAKEFVSELLSNSNDHIRMYQIARLLQIDAYVGLSIKQYKGPRVDFGLVMKSFGDNNKMAQIADDVKHGNKDAVNAFRELLYKFAPAGTICSAPRVTESGVLLDGEVAVQKDEHKLLPLSKWIETKTVPRPILFLGWNHLKQDIAVLSNRTTEERMLGSYQMELRILKNQGFNPVLILNSELTTNDSQSAAVKFIKEKVYNNGDI